MKPNPNLALLSILVCLWGAQHVRAVDSAPGRVRMNINPVWRFQAGEPAGAPFAQDYDDSRWDIVSLPHSHEVFAANLAGFGERGRLSGWYRRQLAVRSAWLGKKLFLEFQGAMQTTALWVNGRKVGDYAVSGYDSFHFDITAYAKEGRNLIAVRVNNRVNPEIPPDGKQMDYILFGGLYRDVFLHVTDSMHLTFPWEARQGGIRLTLPEVSEKHAVVQTESTVRNESARSRRCVLITEVRDREGSLVASRSSESEIAAGKELTFVHKSAPIANPILWSPENPYLYRVRTVVRDGGNELDRIETSLGIRWVRFDERKGFFLNGRNVKLIGANRHQTWPFVGNAVPNCLHRQDAEQLKSMGINWVRLSHYPHDPDFLDMLDELGLMALAEAPTWMAPGPGLWQPNMEASFRSMIRRDRNHPSIIIWNVCINHRPAHPGLVQAAMDEDPARPRGQGRVSFDFPAASADMAVSPGLMNVPTPMDFTHLLVSGYGALSIEHTGHMYPARRGDSFDADTGTNREYEQARRHWEQTNAALLKADNSGLAVWCMYDYNTFHGTREPGFTWHGVFDLFRFPKHSFWWHRSELTQAPMIHVVRIDDARSVVFSNCDQVRLSQDTGTGYREIAIRKPDTSFTGRVPPEPARVAPGETAPPRPPAEIREVKYALRHPPFHFPVEPGARALKAEGITGGIVRVTSEWKRAGSPVALKLEADRHTFIADGSELNRIAVAAVDGEGTTVHNSDAEIGFTIEGSGNLVGENPVRLRAGRAIVLAQSGFVPGRITIRANAAGLRPADVTIHTTPAPTDVDMPVALPADLPTARKVVGGSGADEASPRLATPKPEPLVLEPKSDRKPGVWVESDPLMIPGLPAREIPISVRGGEYRIYNSEWTSRPGKVIGGDAVYVRVKSASTPGGTAAAELTIDETSVRFEVRTHR
jgi:beta-galactosidase